MKTVLLVRSRRELTDDRIKELEVKLGDDELTFVDVEPKTPQELDDLVVQHSASAVLLRENPLPAIAMHRVPVIPLRLGQPLKKLVSVEVELADI